MNAPLMRQMRPLWGRAPQARCTGRFNVMRELAKGRPILKINNHHDEFTDGADKHHVVPTREAPTSGLDATLWAYSGRMAATLPRGSAVVVAEEATASVVSVLHYLEALGIVEGGVRVIGVPGNRESPIIELAQNSVATMREAMGQGFRGGVLIPFIGSRNVTQLADDLQLEAIPGNHRAVNAANNKGLCHKQARAIQVPTPYGHWVRDATGDAALEKAQLAYRDIQGRDPGRKIFGKLARASSGMGVFEVTQEAAWREFLQSPRTMYQLQDADMGLLIDAGVDYDESPNVMVWVGDTREQDVLITASNQLLVKRHPSDASPSVHAGNIGPITENEMERLLPHVRYLVDWLRSIGFRGKAGLDFLIEKETGMPRFLEVNGRENGHNGGAFPAIGYGARLWAAYNLAAVPVDTSLESYVAYLTAQGAHFNPETGQGVFVTNALTSSLGKMQIGIMADSTGQVQDLLGVAGGMTNDG